jgi:ATP-dependent DNA helicase RecQ
VDILLISPERLGNEDFVTHCLLPIAARIGLLVVDEAHCISDWGHDFRPDYRRIVRILRALPPNVPVLATTATANDRVVTDLLEQLGPNLTPIRGPLTRESLRLQNIALPAKAARMAWLAHHLPSLPESGIIYALTKRSVARMLNVPLLKTRAGLKRAIEEGRVQKTKTPVRYVRGSNSLPLFAHEPVKTPLPR